MRSQRQRQGEAPSHTAVGSCPCLDVQECEQFGQLYSFLVIHLAAIIQELHVQRRSCGH